MSGPYAPKWQAAGGVLVGILLGGVGIYLLQPALRLPLSALLHGGLTVLVLAVGMLTRAASPRLAFVRVLGFAAASPVVFASNWVWLLRGATRSGDHYGETIVAWLLYLGTTFGLLMGVAAGCRVAEWALQRSIDGLGSRVRRAARVVLALLLALTLLGGHASLRHPPYERWLSSLPLMEDFGAPATWPATAWSSITATHGEPPSRYRELSVEGHRLRVFQQSSDYRFPATFVRWQGRSEWETPPVAECGVRDCTGANRLNRAPIRVRRDAQRGLWIIDQGDRLSSAVFTDDGARVGPSYASILSSAAPPLSWVIGAWTAMLLAFASMRWPRRRIEPEAPSALPYRAPIEPLDGTADDLRYRALLPDALALTICALNGAPLAAYFLHALVG